MPADTVGDIYIHRVGETRCVEAAVINGSREEDYEQIKDWNVVSLCHDCPALWTAVVAHS
jgi:hypothetical protein